MIYLYKRSLNYTAVVKLKDRSISITYGSICDSTGVLGDITGETA